MRESDLSVTRGVVSAIKSDTGRNIIWLQTDAAINPGNSGGPMLSLQGKVVGVVSTRIGGDVENVGFAVSSNTIKLNLGRIMGEETIVN